MVQKCVSLGVECNYNCPPETISEKNSSSSPYYRGILNGERHSKRYCGERDYFPIARVYKYRGTIECEK